MSDGEDGPSVGKLAGQLGYLFEDDPSEALEATGRIVHREPRDETSVHVGGPRKDEPIEGPVHHPHAADVARAQNQVGVARRGALARGRDGCRGRFERCQRLRVQFLPFFAVHVCVEHESALIDALQKHHPRVGEPVGINGGECHGGRIT